MARRSLEASARQNADLTKVLDQLLARDQVELDLHLEGVGIDNHQANALDFADLVRGIADSVKEITKVSLGRQRLRDSLLILAPQPGSVRMVLRAAPASAVQPKTAEKEPLSADSESLATVATLLMRAEQESVAPDSTVLDGLTAQLPAAARKGILRAAKVIKDSGWDVSGVLRRPDEDPMPVLISGAGAVKLIASLSESEQVIESQSRYGFVDGQRKSTSAMWFSPEKGRAFEAAVVDRELLKKVAELSARIDALTKAVFTVTTKYPAGDNSSPRRSYVLDSIELAPRADAVAISEPEPAK